MKVSMNWVKEYVDIKASVDDVVEKIGAQLGAVEEVIDLGKKYKGIVVAKVIKCEKHPNADKLSLCLIDDGGVTKSVKRDSKGLIQVVCGAPNVKIGMLVAWLPPGSTVPATFDKEPLVLEAREIRGEVSNGMLASAHELDLGDDHSGILEINPEIQMKKTVNGPVDHVNVFKSYQSTPNVKPGDDFAKKYGLDDVIIDIENKMFTHRPDCFGILGVAREIAGIYHLAFHSPKWYLGDKVTGINSTDSKLLTVKNEIPNQVPRFMAQVFENVTISPSSINIQAKLARVGIRPINNIVDITNYLMYLTGQPIHAYDYDKLKQLDKAGHATLIVRAPKPGEKLKLLGGKEIQPVANDIMIASANHLIGLGGVMGGSDTEVDENTKNIVLECATFDMYAIRRTAMRHGLFTDAVTRFNKGQSPWQNDRVMAMAEGDIICEAGGLPARSIYDLKHRLKEPAQIKITADFVNQRLGTKLSLKDMTKLLENVEFKIKTVPADKKHLHIQAPFWRTDIEIPEDIVEEVGRLYGYDHVPLELPRRSIRPNRPDELLDLKNTVRDILAKAGANELLTYSFVHGNLLEKVGQNPKDAFRLSNAISPELQYYRLSLLPSLLEKVHANLKSDLVRGEDNEFALFEINPVHAKDFLDKDGLPIEDQRLALVFAADDKTASRKYQGAAYYSAVSYVTNLFDGLGISSVFHPAKDHQPKASISQAAIAPFDKERTAIIKTAEGDFIGEIGEFSAKTRQNLKLPDFSAGFELDVSVLLKLSQKTSQYAPLSRFPKVMQDITLKVPANQSYGELQDFIGQQLIDILPENTWPKLGMPRIYQSDKDTKLKNMTWRLWLSNYDRTLTTNEVNRYLDDLANRLSSIGATRI